MSRRGRSLRESDGEGRLFRVVKLGPIHRSAHLRTEAQLRDRAVKPLFGTGSLPPWFWDGGPGVGEDFPQ